MNKKNLELKIMSLNIQIDALKKDIQMKKELIEQNEKQLRLNKFKLHKINQEIGELTK